jgi:hypothetical protein
VTGGEEDTFVIYAMIDTQYLEGVGVDNERDVRDETVFDRVSFCRSSGAFSGDCC